MPSAHGVLKATSGGRAILQGIARALMERQQHQRVFPQQAICAAGSICATTLPLWHWSRQERLQIMRGWSLMLPMSSDRRPTRHCTGNSDAMNRAWAPRCRQEYFGIAHQAPVQGASPRAAYKPVALHDYRCRSVFVCGELASWERVME